MGEGVTDPRTFLSVSIPVKIGTSVTVYARRYLVASIKVKAAITAPITGVVQLAVAIKIKAQLVTGTITTYYAKYLSAAIGVKAGVSAGMSRALALASSIPIKVAIAFNGWRGIHATAQIPVKVTIYADATELGLSAPEERMMIVPTEDRKMKVT